MCECVFVFKLKLFLEFHIDSAGLAKEQWTLLAIAIGIDGSIAILCKGIIRLGVHPSTFRMQAGK